MYNSESLEEMLNEIIDRRIKNVLKQQGFEAPYEGEILSVNEAEGNIDPYSQYVDVSVVGYDVVVSLRNLTGELLYVNDRVRIYANNNNLSNGYVGIKCN